MAAVSLLSSYLVMMSVLFLVALCHISAFHQSVYTSRSTFKRLPQSSLRRTTSNTFVSNPSSTSTYNRNEFSSILLKLNTGDSDGDRHRSDDINTATRTLRVPINVTKLQSLTDQELRPLMDMLLQLNTDDKQHTSDDMQLDGTFANFHASSVSSSQVFEHVHGGDTPLQHIRNSLTYGADCLHGQYAINHQAKGNDLETVVLCGPGLDMTMEEGKEMVQFASSVLEGLPLSYLHCATHDIQQIELDVRQNVHQKAYQILMQSAIAENEYLTGSTDDQLFTVADPTQVKFVIQSNDLDRLRMILAGRPGLYDTQFKQTIRKMLDTAVASLEQDNDHDKLTSQDKTELVKQKQPHLVLMSYSAATNQVAAAVSEWIDETISIMMPSKNARAIVEHSLRQSVTVVTVAGTCNSFPDGPAYIHISMRDDPLAATFGVCERDIFDQNIDLAAELEADGTIDLGRKGGGKDAYYLHAYSPYYYAKSKPAKPYKHHYLPLQNDAHNLRAGLIQWLAIIMRVNGTRSFTFLYNIMRDGRLDNPVSLEDEVLPAMIRATKGYRWLWNPTKSLGPDACTVVESKSGNEGTPSAAMDKCNFLWEEDVIPGVDEARCVLEHQFGYDGYDEIVQAMEIDEPATKTVPIKVSNG